ncbi:unnamed protein product [Symbiodinium sp. CCMP2592]|nr:unnamed protein product [Symbiodinium sp. CCMP2592]CAE7346109.1 unnamed protein product [Symbiodinium sp. CCMP2592]
MKRSAAPASTAKRRRCSPVVQWNPQGAGALRASSRSWQQWLQHLPPPAGVIVCQCLAGRTHALLQLPDAAFLSGVLEFSTVPAWGQYRSLWQAEGPWNQRRGRSKLPQQLLDIEEVVQDLDVARRLARTCDPLRPFLKRTASSLQAFMKKRCREVEREVAERRQREVLEVRDLHQHPLRDLLDRVVPYSVSEGERNGYLMVDEAILRNLGYRRVRRLAKAGFGFRVASLAQISNLREATKFSKPRWKRQLETGTLRAAVTVQVADNMRLRLVWQGPVRRAFLFFAFHKDVC